MSKLTMNSENEIPLRHEFVCSGFTEKVASWARFLCLVFLFLHLLATAVNLIYPFAVDPPFFYVQLLFFLFACAAFEIFAIPIESIKDHCIIDLQKTMVVKTYNRYFFNKIEVLATFDKIRTLGVSARPAPAVKGVFSESAKRFAILMLTEKGRLHRLTDYNLGLEEANNLLKSLHESYLRNTDIINGAENIELCLDRHVEKSFVQRPCQRSWLTMVDAALMPAFQASAGAAVVVVLLAIAAVVGNFVAEHLFNTNLKISHQPIIQIVMAPAKPTSDSQMQDQRILTTALPSTSSEAVLAALPGTTPPDKAIAEPEPPIEIMSEPEQNKTSAAAATTSPATGLSDSLPQQEASDSSKIMATFNQAALTTTNEQTNSEVPETVTKSLEEPFAGTDAFPLEQLPDDFIKIVEEDEDNDPVHTKPEPVTLPKPTVPVAAADVKPVGDTPVKVQVSVAKTQIAATTAFKATVKTEKATTAPRATATERVQVRLPAAPVLDPLPSRIPTFDENGIAVPAPAPANIAQPIRLHVPPQTARKNEEKTLPPPQLNQQLASAKIAKAATVTVSAASPDESRAKSRLFSEPPIRSAPKAVTPAPDSILTAGSYVGQSVNFAFNSLGKPLTAIKTSGGEQLIYSGITLLTDSSNKKIIQVNLTSQQNKALGTLATREGLKVGGLVREARERLGVPLQKANSPGLHFPARGISVFPLPGDAETIGSIQIYQASKQSGR